MTTSVILKRNLSGYDVLQRTSDGYFNASVLSKQWSSVEGNKSKKVTDFLRLSATEEFAKEIELKSSESSVSGNPSTNPNGLNSVEGNLPTTDYQAVKVVNKKLKNEKEYWMHPFLFIDFAMWLNPAFKYNVIKFVYDELVKHRINAGDNYKALCSVIKNFKDVDYGKLGTALNWNVFNNHYKDIRNDATSEQENELQELEKTLTVMVESGLITSFEGLLNVMRKMYMKKYCKY